MKKSLKAIVLAVISGLIISGCATKNIDQTASEPTENQELDDKLTVYTSFYIPYDFTSKIGGDKIHVVCIVPSGIEPHDWEPSTSDIANLEEAKILIYSGAGMEHWVEGILSSLSNKELLAIESSKGISLIHGHAHEHEEEEHDDHHDDEERDSLDPHVWLNPMNAKIQAENIKNALSEIDPENAEYYEDNFLIFSNELDKLHQEFIDRLTNIPSRTVIVSHEAFGYLCDAYNLEQVGIEGLSPDSEPTPARMAEIIDFAREHQISTIFFEELVSDKVAKTIASEIQAETAVLSPIEGLSDAQSANGDDYLSVMRQNLDALAKALS